MGKVPKPTMTKVSGIPASSHGPSRPASQVTQATFHHIVGDAAGAIAEMRKVSRQMSWSFAIGSDGKIYEGTGIFTVPYCDGNYASNKRSVSTEHAGGHSSVPYTKAMYDASIKLHAWLIDELGIKSFKRHREVSDKPTACPGQLDVERIVEGAKKLRDSYYEEKEEMLTNRNHLKALFRQFVNRDPKESEYKYYIGKPYNIAVHKLNAARIDLGTVIKERDAALSDSVQLKPGKYVVK